MDSDLLNLDSNPDPAIQVNPDPEPIQVQGFDDQKFEKYRWKFVLSFFDKKLQFTYP